MDIHARLAELNRKLPPAPAPAAVYQPAMRTGDLLVISGQIPVVAGKPIARGPVPSVVCLADAQYAAAQCVLNGLAILDAEIGGDWGRFRRFVRLGVFVYSDAGFAEQHLVANGASSLLEDVFGDRGRHARAAVGCCGLPLGVPVEVEILAEIAPQALGP